MSRAQFDSEQVIENAMLVFWQQGYSGASMQDISAKTGLKPGSIYLAFGNKDGLYRAALDRYAQQSLSFIDSVIKPSASVGEGICQLLNGMIDESTLESFHSCFLVRSRLELPTDHPLHQYAGELLKVVENKLFSYLTTEFTESQARKYAATLVIHIFGVRVYGFYENSQEILRETLKESLPWLPW